MYKFIIRFRKLGYLLIICILLGVYANQSYSTQEVPKFTPVLERTSSEETVSAVALAPTATEAPTSIATSTATPTPTTAPPTLTPTPIFLEAEQAPNLTLDDIFSQRDLAAMQLDPSRLRTLITTGDVIPGRHTDRIIRAQGDDFLYPFAATQGLLSAADLTVISLEAPIIEHCPPDILEFTLCGRPGFMSALQAAGVDVATLENNHMADYGDAGSTETRQHLEEAGITWADRETPAIYDVRGIKFGFLAFNGIVDPIDRQAMDEQIRALRPQVDILAVAMHWGAEYLILPQPDPRLAPDDPMEIAHLAVDAGADLVLGNHPHWVQPVELYKDKLIVYAQGNFIFDQMWSYETRVGVIGRFTFYDHVLVDVKFIPTLIENYAQPVPMQGEEAQAVLDGMRAASEELAQMRVSNP
jgi:hypothetical protein